MEVNLKSGYDWAIKTCADQKVGYSQRYRNQQTVKGIRYYDCSSFVWYALQAAGFDVVQAYNRALWKFNGNAVTTVYMEKWLTELGFTEYSASNAVFKPMDILLRKGHTEIVYEGGLNIYQTMGAHTDKVPLAEQVSIGKKQKNTGYWAQIFRFRNGMEHTELTNKTGDFLILL